MFTQQAHNVETMLIQHDAESKFFFHRYVPAGTCTVRHKRNNVPSDMCVQRRLKSACASVRSECSFSTWINFSFLLIQNAPSGNSDQTVRIRRLIWIFAGRTGPNVRFLTLQFKWNDILATCSNTHTLCLCDHGIHLNNASCRHFDAARKCVIHEWYVASRCC